MGAVAALSLADRGFRILLVDRKKPDLGPTGLGMDIQNVALSPRSRKRIEALASWPDEAAPYNKMKVWEERGVAALEFCVDAIENEALGWIVEKSPLTQKLWLALEDNPAIDIVFGSLETVHSKSTGVCMTLSEAPSTRHSADLLIAADGANSAVRRAMGIPSSIVPADQMAITTIVRASLAHQGTAWQRFLKDGPLALLPGRDPHLCSVVWSQSTARAEHLMALDDQMFADAVARASEFCLGSVQAVADRYVLPLRQQMASTAMPADRVLLIGDALRVVHPLAGLGVNLGFEDIEHLMLIPNRDLMNPSALKKFSRQRVLRSQIMVRALDALRRLYGAQDPLTGWLRNVGVAWVQQQRWLKKRLIMEATGIDSLTA